MLPYVMLPRQARGTCKRTVSITSRTVHFVSWYYVLRQMRIDSSPVAVQYYLSSSLSSEFHSWRFDLFLFLPEEKLPRHSTSSGGRGRAKKCDHRSLSLSAATRSAVAKELRRRRQPRMARERERECAVRFGEIYWSLSLLLLSTF